MSGFRNACRERSIKIDAVAADLVRRGLAPWDAHDRATRIVDREAASEADQSTTTWQRLVVQQNPTE